MEVHTQVPVVARARPTMPSLTQPLRSLIGLGTDGRFPSGGGYYRVVKHRDDIPAVPVALLPDAEAALAALDAYLAPASTKQIAARVTALLAHFFVPDMPVQLQTAVVGDWIRILGRHPFWAIEEACQDWLRTSRSKPSVADIEKRCLEATNAASIDRDVLRVSIAKARERAA